MRGGLGLDRKWPVQESIQWESVGQGDHQRPKKLKKPGVRVRLFSFLLLKKRLGCHVLVHVYSGGETCSKRVSVKLGQT